MSDAHEGQATLGRRDMLHAAAGALAAMMLQPGWVSQARAQAATLGADPRFAFIDRVSELTIPTTDTPGASAAGVPVFVLFALDQRINGLDPALLPTLRAHLDQAAGGGFLARTPADQLRILTEVDAAAYAAPAQAGTPQYAWRRIKAAIVAGYYTSEIGASQELVHEPVPGVKGNIIMDAGYRARSNEGFGGGL